MMNFRKLHDDSLKILNQREFSVKLRRSNNRLLCDCVKESARSKISCVIRKCVLYYNILCDVEVSLMKSDMTWECLPKA